MVRMMGSIASSEHYSHSLAPTLSISWYIGKDMDNAVCENDLSSLVTRSCLVSCLKADVDFGEVCDFNVNCREGFVGLQLASSKLDVFCRRLVIPSYETMEVERRNS